jgi:hypothetical protein
MESSIGISSGAHNKINPPPDNLLRAPEGLILKKSRRHTLLTLMVIAAE